jgi:hypothetical protein
MEGLGRILDSVGMLRPKRSGHGQKPQSAEDERQSLGRPLAAITDVVTRCEADYCTQPRLLVLPIDLVNCLEGRENADPNDCGHGHSEEREPKDQPVELGSGQSAIRSEEQAFGQDQPHQAVINEVVFVGPLLAKCAIQLPIGHLLPRRILRHRGSLRPNV